MEGRFRWDSGPSKAVELSIGKDGYVWIERLKFLPFDHETLVKLKPALYVTITRAMPRRAKRSRSSPPRPAFPIPIRER